MEEAWTLIDLKLVSYIPFFLISLFGFIILSQLVMLGSNSTVVIGASSRPDSRREFNMQAEDCQRIN